MWSTCHVMFVHGWPLSSSRGPGPNSIWCLVVLVEIKDFSSVIVGALRHGRNNIGQQECLVHMHEGPARDFSAVLPEAHQEQRVGNRAAMARGDSDQGIHLLLAGCWLKQSVPRA